MADQITAKQIQEVKELNSLDFFAKQIVEGFITGMHRSPFHGFSVEFAEHRLYNPGESIKHIDWKLYGRTDKLFVKRFEEETNLRCQVLVDCSSSMLFPVHKPVNKLDFSAYSAAAIIYLLRKQRDAVGLTLFNDQLIYYREPRISNSHVRNLYSELDKLIEKKYNPKQRDSTQIAEVLHQIAEAASKRSLVVLFTDMFEEEKLETLMNAIEHLRYNKHEVVVFHVYDQQIEEQLLLDDRPYRFVDMESGEEMKLQPQDIRQAFSVKTREFFAELKARCLQYKVDFVPADINKPFDQVLLSFLAKRTRLF